MNGWKSNLMGKLHLLCNETHFTNIMAAKHQPPAFQEERQPTPEQEGKVARHL